MPRIIKGISISPEKYRIRHLESAGERAPSDQEGDRASERTPSLAEVQAKVADMVHEAQQQAEQIVKQAEGEAQNILEQSRARAEREAGQLKRETEEKAKKEGFEQGRQEIQQQLKEESEAFVNALGQALQQLEEEKQMLVKQVEPRLLTLACHIAGQIVRDRIERDDETVMRIVHRAIEMTKERASFVLRLNPADAESLREKADDLIQAHEGVREIRFEADPRIEQGGCLVETASGYVDARLEQQMGEFRQMIVDARPGPKEEKS